MRGVGGGGWWEGGVRELVGGGGGGVGEGWGDGVCVSTCAE